LTRWPGRPIRRHLRPLHAQGQRDNARLAKDGANLDAEGSLDGRDLLALVPSGLELTDVFLERGSLVLVGSFSALGVRVSAPARVVAQAGNVVLKPEGLAGAAVSSIPVFSDTASTCLASRRERSEPACA